MTIQAIANSAPGESKSTVAAGCPLSWLLWLPCRLHSSAGILDRGRARNERAQFIDSKMGKGSGSRLFEEPQCTPHLRQGGISGQPRRGAIRKNTTTDPHRNGNYPHDSKHDRRSRGGLRCKYHNEAGSYLAFFGRMPYQNANLTPKCIFFANWVHPSNRTTLS